MRTIGRVFASAVLATAVLSAGCAGPQVDLATLERPARAAELDAYDAFVGSWSWEATSLNADGEEEAWTGTAKWDWTLDKRCLHGHMSVHGANIDFEATGIWGWHAKDKKYIWWMFNNWGYPQQGPACYDADARCWTLPYKGVGLDGTCSYGKYVMKVVDNDTLEWTMTEWADMMYLFKKMEMTGAYKRQK